MGRSKERGRDVEELSKEDLLREQHRCQNMLRIFGNTLSGKGLRKRLHEINRRIEREQSE